MIFLDAQNEPDLLKCISRTDKYNEWRRMNGPLHISSISRSKCDIDS